MSDRPHACIYIWTITDRNRWMLKCACGLKPTKNQMRALAAQSRNPSR